MSHLKWLEIEIFMVFVMDIIGWFAWSFLSG